MFSFYFVDTEKLLIFLLHIYLPLEKGEATPVGCPLNYSAQVAFCSNRKDLGINKKAT
jgi:hypothetical protein